MASKMACLFCSRKFDSKDEWSYHISLHVIETVRRDYPGLLEMIEKVERNLPVKFLVKVDADKVSEIHNLSQSILDEAEKETES